MKRLVIFSFFLLAGFAVSAKEKLINYDNLSSGQRLENEDSESPVVDPTKNYARFSQHQDNIVIFDYFRGPESAGHMDVSTSFRYLMTTLDLKEDTDWTVFLSYTGEFDFFANSRPSGPVVSTKNNPAIHYAYFFPQRTNGLLEWRLSLEHESNGQSTDSNRQLEIQKRNFRSKYGRFEQPSQSEIEQMARETISRSNNFASFGGAYRFDSASPFDLYFKFRHQLSYGLEDEIWWDDTQSHIQLKDFVGIELSLDSTFTLFGTLNSVTLTYRTGQVFGGNPGRNNTFDFKYFIDIPVGKLGGIFSDKFAIPFVLSCHTGYLEEFYRYSEKSSYCAVGLNARY